MAVGTAYKQVRLYDVRESSKTRRPTSLTPEGLFDYRITSLCQIDENEIAVGDASGDILTVDLRRLGRNAKGPANRDLARYAGPAGSVRQLKKHPTLPRLTAVGLDRMLRVYDTNTRKQLDCVYLKQRLNCVLCHRSNTCESSDDTSVVSDDDYDKMDDIDIDQDDVVEDYIDSDDSDGESVKSENEDGGWSDSGSKENNDSEGTDESDSDDESLDEVDSEEEMSGSNDESEDEEEISQTTKRRRRK